MAYNIDWKYKKDIKTLEDIQYFIDVFRVHRPKIIGIDTETTGVHIIKDRPFLIAFGFYTKEKIGYTFTYDFENGPDNHNMMRILYRACEQVDKVAFHNTTFDMHMLSNIGYPYPHENITDTQILIRLAHDAVSIDLGGAPLGLKDYASRYIDGNAAKLERELKAEIRSIHAANNTKLKDRLKGLYLPEEYKISPTNKTWTKGIIDNFLKDSINEIEDLPIEVQKAWELWQLEDYIEPSYNNLNRDVLTKYAHLDIIFTLEVYDRCKPVVYAREQEKILLQEEELILPLYRMEKVGFSFNQDYAIESKERMRNYIIECRSTLYRLAGEKISVGQHLRIGQLLYTKWGITSHATDLQELKFLSNDKVLSNLLKEDIPKEARNFIEIVQELRTLEKWYSTYVLKWINASYNGRIYTQINQSGTVSGRVSSDFQQFPRKGIKDREGNLLFNPRRLIKVSGGEYPIIAYLDYSQIELRFQALYTIFISGGDTNLCRAFMPFQCYRLDSFNNKWYFNHENINDISTFKQYKWYHIEDGKEWHPIDLHSQTAMTAYGVDQSHPNFKEFRAHGKTTNFACNYGASISGLMNAGLERETAKKMYEGYLKAYPKLQDYRQYVQDFLKVNPYIENLFGRKYYGANAHVCANYLVQGSAADFLKRKIIEVDRFLIENNYKTRFQMNIHDEMSFEVHKDEYHIIQDIQKIMQDLPGSKVPIIADIEISRTTWDEKEDV